MTLINHPIRAFAALLLLIVSLLGMTAPAQAADSGSLTWGFKSSWRFYVVTIATGTISTSGGATTNGSGEYVFPQESTTQTSPTGAGITKYSGSVNWKSTAHGFDITMSNPWLEVTSPTEATLTADLTDSAGTSRGRVDMATVTLNDPTVETDSLTWTDRPTVITEEAAETFDNYANAAGDPVDAVVHKPGIGNPAPNCDGQPATVQLGLGQVPTDGDDVIVGTDAGDAVDAGGGNDVICALGGYDSLSGGDGNDRLFGDGGNDTINGGAGNDSISGGTGVDLVYGGTGGDSVFGGSGLDTFSFAPSTAGVKVTLDNVANDGNTADGRADNVRTDVERVNGSAYADTMLGSAGVNYFYGYGGNDLLYGYGSNDYLNGGTHADTFNGGTGNDSLNAKDGLRDKVIDGGTGRDAAARDGVDPAARNIP